MKEVLKTRKVFIQEINKWKEKEEKYRLLKDNDTNKIEEQLIELM